MLPLIIQHYGRTPPPSWLGSSGGHPYLPLYYSPKFKVAVQASTEVTEKRIARLRKYVTLPLKSENFPRRRPYCEYFLNSTYLSASYAPESRKQSKLIPEDQAFIGVSDSKNIFKLTGWTSGRRSSLEQALKRLYK